MTGQYVVFLNGRESLQKFHRLLFIYIYIYIYILLLEIQLSREECWDKNDNFTVKLIFLFNWDKSIIQYPAKTISKMIHYFHIDRGRNLRLVYFHLLKKNMHSPVYKGYLSQLVLLLYLLLY